MIGIKYNFTGKMNPHEFGNKVLEMNQIKGILTEGDLRVEELVNSYDQRGKKYALINMDIKIYSDNDKTQEDLKNEKIQGKIESKLEDILGGKLTNKFIF
jgi:hypothetical protein